MSDLQSKSQEELIQMFQLAKQEKNLDLAREINKQLQQNKEFAALEMEMSSALNIKSEKVSQKPKEEDEMPKKKSKATDEDDEEEEEAEMPKKKKKSFASEEDEISPMQEMTQKRMSGFEVSKKDVSFSNQRLISSEEKAYTEKQFKKHVDALTTKSAAVLGKRSFKDYEEKSEFVGLDDFSAKSLYAVTDQYANMPNVPFDAVEKVRDQIEYLHKEFPKLDERTQMHMKSAYNTQIGTQAGLIGPQQQIQFGKKYFSYSPLISMVTVIPTVAQEVKVICESILPVPTVVAEGTNVADNAIGEFEEVKIGVRSYYQVTQKVTDLLMQSDSVAVMSKLQQLASKSLSMLVARNVLQGDGGGDDQIQGILAPSIANYDITSLSSEASWNAKPAGQRRVLRSQSATTIGSLDNLKALISVTAPDYINENTCFYMSPKTWQYISTQKTSTNAYIFDSIAFAMHGGLNANIREHAYSEANNLRTPLAGLQDTPQNKTKYFLFGFPVVLDALMPEIAAGAIPILFGDFRESYTMAQTIGLGVRPILVGAMGSNGTVLTNGQFQSAFQVFMQAGGKVTNSQALTGLYIAA